MGDLATTAFAIFLILLGISAAAFLAAWIGARLARKRYEASMHSGRGSRSWGGKDYERVRTKYFDKERRARAVRDHHRSTHSPPPEAEPAAPEISDLDQFHRETLGLTGVEISRHVLREAYKQRIREYHPDRVATLGVKLRILAEEETKRINDAYRYLRRRIVD